MIIDEITNVDWQKQAVDFAEKCYPEECCGIVAIKNKKQILWECENIAWEFKAESFVIKPEDWADCEDSVDEIIGILHSHPDGEFKFSEQDILSCQKLDIPFYLVEPSSNRIIKIEPKNL